MDRTLVILKLLQEANEPMEISKLAEASGMDPHEVDKAIKKLKEEGKVTSPHRSFWTLVK